ncbi:MAG: hypothetical protein AB7T31_00465 [Gemmatimonadales bacterium]
MGPLIWFTFWGILTVLVIAACILVYVRRRASFARRTPRVDDDAVKAIVETGALAIDDDEPLDMREIEEQEERFWSETWDEPEEV